MIRLTDTEFTITLTALNTKANGKRISNMERATNHGLMEASSRATTSSLKRRAEGCIPGLMETSTSETGRIT